MRESLWPTLAVPPPPCLPPPASFSSLQPVVFHSALLSHTPQSHYLTVVKQRISLHASWHGNHYHKEEANKQSLFNFFFCYNIKLKTKPLLLKNVAVTNNISHFQMLPEVSSSAVRLSPSSWLCCRCPCRCQPMSPCLETL